MLASGIFNFKDTIYKHMVELRVALKANREKARLHVRQDRLKQTTRAL